MDTPDRSKIGTPVSKFEDSPVFNYISNLSPIKPVKSVHITQTFQSLSFVTSLPSVFTSPHISSHKESRFLKRHNLSDLSKPEFDDSHESKTSLGVEDTIHLPGDSADTPERCDDVTSMEEFNVDPLNKCSKLSIKLSQTLQYDCASPKSDTTSFCGGIKTDADMEMSATPVSLIRLVQEAPEERQRHSLETEVESQERFRLEQSKEEVPGFNWEYLISDDADEVLIYDSSANQSEAFKGSDQTLADANANDFALHISKCPNDKTDDLHKEQSAGSHCSFYQHHKQDCAVHPEEVTEQNETDHTPELLSSTFQNKQGTGDISDKTDNRLKECISLGIKIETQQQRGMRRRCLVFEMTGSKKKTSEVDSKSCSSNLMQSGGTVSLGDKRLATVKSPIGSLPCMLPGIGLHLNALATASKECRMVKHETLASGNQLVSKPTTVGSLHSATTGQESSDKSLALISVERDLGSAGNEVQVMKDAFQAPSLGAVTEFNQNSPKKKRCKLENAGESESCKRCNCKKSKCLKLYCECFAAGVYCVEPCSCQDCFNKPIHEDTVLATRKQIESRNPLAFAPKVIRSSEPVPDIGEEGNNTPASARHKRGCNCKKSSCLKKYCECYQGGVGCSSNCRCEGCKNAFGRKDGYVPPVIEEADLEDEESEAGNKDELDDSLQTMEVQKDEQKHFDAILPMTPVQHCRPPVEQQCFSGGRPPRSSLVAVGTSQLRTCQTLRKSAFPCPQPEIEKQVQNFPEDETPDILRASSSSLNGVKSASPNRKRVSPPHNQVGSSPGQRGARKLILQSVPPFPSLNHHGQIFR